MAWKETLWYCMVMYGASNALSAGMKIHLEGSLWKVQVALGRGQGIKGVSQISESLLYPRTVSKSVLTFVLFPPKGTIPHQVTWALDHAKGMFNLLRVFFWTTPCFLAMGLRLLLIMYNIRMISTEVLWQSGDYPEILVWMSSKWQIIRWKFPTRNFNKLGSQVRDRKHSPRLKNPSEGNLVSAFLGRVIPEFHWISPCFHHLLQKHTTPL